MDDIEEKIQAVLWWAESEPGFDSRFIESLQDYYELKGYLTDSQLTALDNIIDKWSIDV